MPRTTVNERIIMGIDPGTTVMGYAIIQAKGKKLNMVVMGVIELQKYRNHYSKLQKIFDRVTQLIVEYQPTELAIEAPFYGKNVQSMLKLGRAQGVAMAAALVHKMSIFEYAPRKIKNAITGLGSATKEQVAAILKHELKLSEIPTLLDATDALGAAVCHYYQSLLPVSSKDTAIVSSSKWSDYIKNNPDKVKNK